MSQFISVHDVVFGHRPPELNESHHNDLRKATVKVRQDEAPVDIAKVVCAIEDCKTYHYDDFGRFRVATDDQKEKIKAALARYHKETIFGYTGELFDSYRGLQDRADGADWISTGWLEDDLPNFEACYEQWKINNEMDGKVSPAMLKGNQDPYAQNRIWNFMSRLLTVTVGKAAYELIQKGDYKLAISALEDNGLRWSEHEKKMLRRHLKTIVTSAQ
jgi:hypothetical protein